MLGMCQGSDVLDDWFEFRQRSLRKYRRLVVWNYRGLGTHFSTAQDFGSIVSAFQKETSPEIIVCAEQILSSVFACCERPKKAPKWSQLKFNASADALRQGLRQREPARDEVQHLLQFL
jgi:hypothetical protein